MKVSQGYIKKKKISKEMNECCMLLQMIILMDLQRVVTCIKIAVKTPYFSWDSYQKL